MRDQRRPDGLGDQVERRPVDLAAEQRLASAGLGLGRRDGVGQRPAAARARRGAASATREQVVAERGPRRPTRPSHRAVRGQLVRAPRRRHPQHQLAPSCRGLAASRLSRSARKRSTTRLWRSSSSRDSPTIRPASVVASCRPRCAARRRPAGARPRSGRAPCSTIRAASAWACSRISAMIAAPCSRASSRIRAASWRASASCSLYSSSACCASASASSSSANCCRIASWRVGHRPVDRRDDVLGEDAEHDQERDQLDEERPVRDQEVALHRDEQAGNAAIVGSFSCAVSVVLRSGSASAEDEDEQRHEGEVDEEHRLDQTDRQEEDRLQAALGLGLAGDALDVATNRPGRHRYRRRWRRRRGPGHRRRRRRRA